MIGIVANALGYQREDDLSSLAPLVFAVRADRPGHPAVDHQTAGGGQPAPATRLPSAYGAPRGLEPDLAGTLQASEAATARTTVLVIKQYLADAAFLAGLTTPDKDLADEIAEALTRPARPLYLGRRSCPPAHPIHHGTTPSPRRPGPTGSPCSRRPPKPAPGPGPNRRPVPGASPAPNRYRPPSRNATTR